MGRGRGRGRGRDRGRGRGRGRDSGRGRHSRFIRRLMFDMLPWGSRPPACVLVGSCPCARVLCPLRTIALPYSTRSLLILFPSSPIPRARCPAYPPFAIPSPAFVSFCLIPLTFYLPPLLFPYPSPLLLLAGGGGMGGGFHLSRSACKTSLRECSGCSLLAPCPYH